MEDVARIVLGLEQPAVAEEVMHFLDRTGRARVVATASDDRQLAEAVRQVEPDAVVASPALVGSAETLNGSLLLAVDTNESVRSLRGALAAGARGYFLWPVDREGLAAAAARALRPQGPGRPPGRVIAVWGPRGGSGTTFVATHLAAALSRRRRECSLLDLDLAFGDVGPVCGAPTEEPLRSIDDLLPLVDELSPRHLDEVLWPHPAGFRVLFAPGDPGTADRVRPKHVRAVIEAARGAAEVVILHLPRAFDPATREALDRADVVLVVLRLDVPSFRAAKRGIAAAGFEERCAFVVNRAVRSEIAPSDVERVFGRAPVAVIRSDRNVPTAQDRGRLLSLRGRTGRAIDRVARSLMEPAA